jgi:hypothetical protein
MQIADFIDGKCAAVDVTDKFIHDWVKTSGNPCNICYTDKSKCSLYKKSVESVKPVGHRQRNIAHL